MLKTNDLITVILQKSVSLRLAHWCIKFFALFIYGAVFTSHISKTSVVSVTPKILKVPVSNQVDSFTKSPFRITARAYPNSLGLFYINFQTRDNIKIIKILRVS